MIIVILIILCMIILGIIDWFVLDLSYEPETREKIKYDPVEIGVAFFTTIILSPIISICLIRNAIEESQLKRGKRK